MNGRARTDDAVARRRGLPRFALRSLLVVVTLLAIALACLGNLWHRVKQQRLIVARIEAAGGVASYDYEFLTDGNLDYTHDAE
jgi:hypothetical protein